ncbi:MAG: hypothetical protein JRF53_14315 [Deltaproteobacteria bacterium]|nr:hypothetical protein [Deltaproteobacteria bacterium]MBW2345150.1 hypothetical protein [Deltaproteobacteria bacterium]
MNPGGSWVSRMTKFSPLRNVSQVIFSASVLQPSSLKFISSRWKGRTFLWWRFFPVPISNAIIHRDYSILGSDIKVAIFDDMLEITSPGPLPDTMPIEKLAQDFLKSGIVSWLPYSKI